MQAVLVMVGVRIDFGNCDCCDVPGNACVAAGVACEFADSECD